MIIKHIVSAALILSFSMSSTILVFGMVIPPPVTPISEEANQAGELATSDSQSVIANTDTKASVKKTEESSNDGTGSKSSENTPGSSSGSGSSEPSNPSSPSTPAPSPSPAPPPSSPAPPPPTAPSCGAGGPCTTAQVSTHNSQSDCWVIYNGNVYDVTGFVSRHGGGRAVFNSNTCGKDIGVYLSGTREPVSGERYNHSSGDISDINPYYIAELS